jgi:hypothetical protein
MKKFLDLFKIKKSKVVEELTKEFDNDSISLERKESIYRSNCSREYAQGFMAIDS